MPRITKPLTDREIKTAKPKEKNYKMFDGNGLYLEVTKAGGKIWKLKYRLNNKEKKYTIGKYPLISLQEAREITFKLKKDLIDGIDIQKKKQNNKNEEFKEEKKIKDVIDEWLRIKEKEIATNTYLHYISRFKNYILPFVGDRNIKQITKDDLKILIKEMQNVPTTTSKKSNKVYTIRRVWNDFSKVFRYAYQHDYVDINIVEKIDINEYLPKHKKQFQIKALTNESDVKQLFNSILEYPSEVTRYALEFLALNALRPANVFELEWNWIDFNKKIISYPDTAMKVKLEYRLPLTKRSLEILDIMKSYTYSKSKYVFCSPLSVTKKMSENTLNFAHKRMGYPDHNAHGWRSSFSTICYENMDKHGFSEDVIEAQLAHKINNKVKKAYLRSDFVEKRRDLLEWWVEFLCR